MNVSELIHKVKYINDLNAPAVMASFDRTGGIGVRWMIPVLLDVYPNAIFSIVSKEVITELDLEKHTEAEWMFQTLVLDEIIRLHGSMRVVESPTVRREFMEAARSFSSYGWMLDGFSEENKIIETVISYGTYYSTMTGIKETISFLEG